MSAKLATSERAATESADSAERPVHIYALVGDDGLPRYVGQTCDLHTRLGVHLSEHAAPKVRAWVATLALEGKRPTMVVLYVVQPGEDSDKMERKFIALLSTTRGLFNDRPGPKRKSVAATQAAVLLAQKLDTAGLSQRELASKLLVSPSVVCRWFSGQTSPRLRHALAIQTEFGVPASLWDVRT